MDSDVSYSEDDDRQEQEGVSSIYPEEEKGDHRKRRACHRNAEKAAVKILHRLFAPEVPEPVYLIENHKDKGRDEPPDPIGVPDVEIREDEGANVYQRLPGPLESQRNLILFCRILLISFGLVFRPDHIGNERHDQKN